MEERREKGKGEKKEREERKERKRKRKRERDKEEGGRRFCSSVHWSPDGRNSLNQGVKGCFRSEFGLKNCIYGSFQNVPTTLGHAIAWIGAVVWLLVYSNFKRPYLFRPNSDSRILRLYEKLFESRI